MSDVNYYLWSRGELLGYPIEKPAVGWNAYIVVAKMAYIMSAH